MLVVLNGTAMWRGVEEGWKGGVKAEGWTGPSFPLRPINAAGFKLDITSHAVLQQGFSLYPNAASFQPPRSAHLSPALNSTCRPSDL